MDRRFFLALAAAGVAGAAAAQELPGIEADFQTWLNGFFEKALAAGLPRALLDRELSGLSPDPRIVALDSRQPEFSKPVSDYIESAVSAARVAEGRAKRYEVAGFSTIEQTWGVPRDILIAVWAMESAFGAQQGSLDIIRSLATLAQQGRRRDWAEDQIIAALRMIADGYVTREQLRGSWAGAMGQTQVLPTVYLSTAVTPSGAGRADVWDSAPDALATAAHLLAKNGWQRSEGWAYEVILPQGFDYSLSETPAQTFSYWAEQGVRRAHGLAWPPADAGAAGVLLLPSGWTGPAFLALPNHFVIRSYNNSIAYALAVGLLADRFAGAPDLETPWPRETPLSLTDRMAAQNALMRLGFDPGSADGLVGSGTRKALRGWQKKMGLPADGYLSPWVLQRLEAAAG
jgi:membrane-bound lytic murein transglycosylase B